MNDLEASADNTSATKALFNLLWRRIGGDVKVLWDVALTANRGQHRPLHRRKIQHLEAPLTTFVAPCEKSEPVKGTACVFLVKVWSLCSSSQQ